MRIDAVNEDATYQTRVASLRREMAVAGVDLLVIYSNGQHSFTTPDGVRYVAGLKPMGPHAAILLPKDDDPTLILTPRWDQGRAQKRTTLKRVVGTDDFINDLPRLLRDGRVHLGKVGIIGGAGLSPRLRDALRDWLGGPPVPFDCAFDGVAEVRDELERSLLERAAEIAERGYERFLEVARPGLFEYELAAEVDRYMKALGADDNFQMIAASQHNLAVRASTDRRLDVSDVILAEITPSVDGQFAQICRTAVIGPASSVQRECYQLLVEGMLAGLQAGRPGVLVSEVVRAVNGVVAAAGYEKYCSPPHMRARGHGLGLGSFQPGDLTIDNQKVLRAGMTFILHPNQYLPGSGYLLCGEPVVVSEIGLRPLTCRQPGLDSIPV